MVTQEEDVLVCEVCKLTRSYDWHTGDAVCPSCRTVTFISPEEFFTEEMMVTQEDIERIYQTRKKNNKRRFAVFGVLWFSSLIFVLLGFGLVGVVLAVISLVTTTALWPISKRWPWSKNRTEWPS